MTKKGEKALASAAIMGLVVTTALSTTNVKAAEVNRVGGQNRIETANNIATDKFESADTVILVNGWGYADAVSATPLSKQLDAPILLTQNKGELEADVKDAIKELGAKKVVVIGGKGVVSEKIQKDLEADYTVERLAGKDDTTRMGTNAAVAEAVLNSSNADTAVLVNGQDGYADALSVASIAAAKGYPVLFAKTTGVAKSVKSVIDAKGLKVLAVGGKGVLPDAVVDTVDGERIAAGADRFDTNLKVLKYFKDIDFSNMYMAAGGQAGAAGANQFADALVASAAAAKTGAPVVLTGLGSNADQKENAANYINSNFEADTNITIVGGTGSIDADVEDDIKDMVVEEKPDLTEIKKVEAKTTLVDFKEDGTQTLEMRVNGGKVTVEDLDEAGYDVEFQATEDVFEQNTEDDENISNTGDLNKTKLENVYNKDKTEEEDFSYKVVVMKNDQIVGQSEEIDVDIIDGEATANKVNEYKLKLVKEADNATAIDVANALEIESGKLVEGEEVQVTDVKADTVDGKKNVDITGSVTLETSDPFIAEVDGKKIIAKSEGTVDIIIKSGSYKKKVSLRVLEDNADNERKVDKVDSDTSSIKVAKEGVKTVELTFLDQYGDPIRGAEQGAKFEVKESIKDGNDKEIAKASVIQKDGVTGTDEDGKIDVKVQANETRTGKGDLEIKKSNGAKVRTIPVQVTADAVYEKVEFEAKDSDSEDFKLDINPEAADENGDDVVTLELNKKTKNDSLIGPADNNEFVIEVKQGDKNIPIEGLSKDNTISIENGKIEVKLDRDKIAEKDIDEGYITLVAKETDSSISEATQKIYIKDSSPTISSVDFKENVETTSHRLALDSIINIDNYTDSIKDEDNNTIEVKNAEVKSGAIKINGSAGDGKVRISENGVVYINTTFDSKATDKFEPEFDVYLGKLVGAKKDGNVKIPTKNFVTGTGTDANYEIGFNFEDDNNFDGTVTIGLTKAHDSAPFESVEVDVEGDTQGEIDAEADAEAQASALSAVKAELAKLTEDANTITLDNVGAERTQVEAVEAKIADAEKAKASAEEIGKLENYSRLAASKAKIQEIKTTAVSVVKAELAKLTEDANTITGDNVDAEKVQVEAVEAKIADAKKAGASTEEIEAIENYSRLAASKTKIQEIDA